MTFIYDNVLSLVTAKLTTIYIHSATSNMYHRIYLILENTELVTIMIFDMQNIFSQLLKKSNVNQTWAELHEVLAAVKI